MVRIRKKEVSLQTSSMTASLLLVVKIARFVFNCSVADLLLVPHSERGYGINGNELFFLLPATAMGFRVEPHQPRSLFSIFETISQSFGAILTVECSPMLDMVNLI